MENTTDNKDLVHGWKGISAVLGCSLNTAKAYFDEHGLPVQKIGGRYLASKSALVAWQREFERKRREERSRRKTLKRSSKQIAVVGILASILLAILLRWLWRPSEEIGHVVVRDAELVAFGESGRVLWSVPLPPVDPNSFITGQHYFLRDVNKDGRRELVFSVRPRDSHTSNSWLICLDSVGQELWRFDYGRELRVGDRLFPRNFEGVYVSWVEANEQDFILTLGYHRPFYPTQVALLEPATGSLVGEYFHQGQLGGLKGHTLVDIDSDPDKEILLGGINNPGLGNGRAVLVALDMPFPATVESFFGIPSAKEVAYLVFPTTDVITAQSGLSAVREVGVQQDGRILVGAGIDEGKLLLHYFDADLELLEVWPSDGLVREHNRLFRLGVLDHEFAPEVELQEWSRVLRFDQAPNANLLGGEAEH